MTRQMQMDPQQAYVLRTLHYRNTSLLVELLTPDYGLIKAVARGANTRHSNRKASAYTGRSVQRKTLIQPFTPLLITWGGKSDLKTLYHWEAEHALLKLVGPRLLCAFYINELLIRLLPSYDANTALFALYQTTLQHLVSKDCVDSVLRRFELTLLTLLGYGLDFTVDSITQQAIEPNKLYCFHQQQSFTYYAGNAMSPPADCFWGEDLLAIAQGQFADHRRQTAKRLCRLALKCHLGDRPLKSISLFQ